MVTTDHPQNSRLAGAIRGRRIELDLSQDDVSRATGISRTVLSAMENGRFGSVRLLLEVCDALGLEVFAFGREDIGRVLALGDDALLPLEQNRNRVSRARGARG